MDLLSYYEELSEGVISGVNDLRSVPSQIQTAHLPCKYVKYGSTTFGISSLDNGMGLPLHTFDIVFLIEPVGQNNNILNQIAVLNISSLIYGYLDAIDNILTVESNTLIIVINGINYWGFVVTVTILGIKKK